jgi:hypothetical protein
MGFGCRKWIPLIATGLDADLVGVARRQVRCSANRHKPPRLQRQRKRRADECKIERPGRARKAWIWSSQRMDISNAELVQLRVFQVGSIVGGVLYVVASVIEQLASLLGFRAGMP